MLLLEVVIVHVDLRPELDLLDLDHALVLLGLASALLLLVLVLAEVHDPADRRHRGRRDLDEVEALLLRDDQRLRRRHDAELLSGFVDHADLADPDALVGAHAIVTSGRTVESDIVLLRLGLSRLRLGAGAVCSAFVPYFVERGGDEAVHRPARPGRPRTGCAPTRYPRPLRGPRLPACTGPSEAGPPGSYSQSSPGARPVPRAARPPRADRARRGRMQDGGRKSAGPPPAPAPARAARRRRNAR